MRDAAKPLLIPCYDAATGAPYVFSRADAVEGDAYDFFVRDVCAAAYGSAAAAATAAAVSVDGATRVLPAASATAMASPAAAAVTHVLHNKQEFPFVAGVGDLLVVSIGNGGGSGGGAAASEAAEELLRIAGATQADMVDQVLGFAFGESRSASYVRIQGDGVTAVGRRRRCWRSGASSPSSSAAEDDGDDEWREAGLGRGGAGQGRGEAAAEQDPDGPDQARRRRRRHAAHVVVCVVGDHRLDGVRRLLGFSMIIL
uniref:Uncharacterized protein n=1 Tax=Ananas comosus var. bracteatus TaxID=296719 RepID=A0A6V7NXD8_ANACO|nr:unnamed protein product [Ananas comosus var. bracteatus]